MLEAAEAELSGTIARLERKVALLMKERTMLKEIVDSYDAEEAIHGGKILWHLSAAIFLSDACAAHIHAHWEERTCVRQAI